jgi:hypothetical protein
MSLVSTQLGTSPSNIFVASGNTVISTMYFCNQSGSAVNLNVYALASGNVVAAANVIIYNQVQIAGQDTFVVDWEKLALGPGDILMANASAGSSITATVSYLGI